MDASSSVPLLNYGLTQYQWSCPSSDSEFYSVSSPETVSPVPSLDYSVSPSYYRSSAATQGGRTAYSPSETPKSSSPCSSYSPPPGRPGRKPSRTRSRVRSKQRESASEKEKLRMRDLTKALHHLRGYLPPSVVPAGQTLTKIETLRLAIRYISHLSAQLGSGPGALQDGETSPGILGYLQCGSATGPSWTPGSGQEQYPAAPCPAQSQVDSLVHSGGCGSAVDVDQYSGQYSGSLQGDLSSTMEAFLQRPPTAQATSLPSAQMYGKHFCGQLVPNEYWG